ncbi:MAG: heme ABC transporter permease [Alphaproteobacteria bacterium]|nr:heme ABC transporter permease [Alphaproteobacteria bacterium]
MLTRYANPARFMALSSWAMPLAAVLAVAAFAIGLPWGLLYAPADYQQGESVRILYVHVPAAWWALGIYTAMTVASVMSLVWRHLLADVAARAMAPVGAAYCGLCLVTGSLWGEPTWGTWWVWDARLTSMLVLFLTYLGYLALWASVEDETRAARLAAILCLAGFINIPIVRFSVEWWSTLHQGPSLLRQGGSAIDPSMLTPLLIMAGAYAAAAAAIVMALMRAEIYRRRAMAAATRRAAQPA